MERLQKYQSLSKEVTLHLSKIEPSTSASVLLEPTSRQKPGGSFDRRLCLENIQFF